MKIKINQVVDVDGRVRCTEKFTKREANGWLGALSRSAKNGRYRIAVSRSISIKRHNNPLATSP